jgi:hypothetical protein
LEPFPAFAFLAAFKPALRLARFSSAVSFFAPKNGLRVLGSALASSSSLSVSSFSSCFFEPLPAFASLAAFKPALRLARFSSAVSFFAPKNGLRVLGSALGWSSSSSSLSVSSVSSCFFTS